MLESGGKIRDASDSPPTANWKIPRICEKAGASVCWATGQEKEIIEAQTPAASAFLSRGIFWQCPHCVDESNFPWESIRDSSRHPSQKESFNGFSTHQCSSPFFANLSKLGTLATRGIIRCRTTALEGVGCSLFILPAGCYSSSI